MAATVGVAVPDLIRFRLQLFTELLFITGIGIFLCKLCHDPLHVRGRLGNIARACIIRIAGCPAVPVLPDLIGLFQHDPPGLIIQGLLEVLTLLVIVTRFMFVLPGARRRFPAAGRKGACSRELVFHVIRGI